MKRLNILIIIMTLLLISIVQAAPASKVTAVQTNTQGFDIVYPKNPAFMQGEGFKLHFHVFNISNGMPINPSTASCNIHIYNKSNSHILNQNLTIDSNGQEYAITLNSTMSSEIGEYPYIVMCNQTANNLGGYISNTYEVTQDGRYYSENTTALPFIIFVLGVVGIFFWFGSMLKEDEWAQGLKLLMYLGGLAILIIGAGYLLVNMQSMSVSQGSYNMANVIYLIILWLLVFIIAVFSWIFITKLINFIRNLRRPDF